MLTISTLAVLLIVLLVTRYVLKRWKYMWLPSPLTWLGGACHWSYSFAHVSRGHGGSGEVHVEHMEKVPEEWNDVPENV